MWEWRKWMAMNGRNKIIGSWPVFIYKWQKTSIRADELVFH